MKGMVWLGGNKEEFSRLMKIFHLEKDMGYVKEEEMFSSAHLGSWLRPSPIIKDRITGEKQTEVY